ncbi:MAG: FMN-dependent NADH-azoreductase [Alcaligenaceae bacterium]|nr:FMN-dependent NADH-azoreductase [Alcaligenaceae bacterium]
MTLLHVDSSILNDQSVSRQLTATIVEQLKQSRPESQVAYLDLVADPVEHLTKAEFVAWQGVAPSDKAAEQAAARNAELLAQFLAADTVVIGAPMYNFSIPTQLRAWLDRLAVAGQTFRYTAQGAEGLAGGKRVVIASSRGGIYTPGSPAASVEFQESYLRGFFGFLGITDLTFVRAEGLALGEDSRNAAVDAATAQAQALAL